MSIIDFILGHWCEHATAELSFPTYLGLMGTFAGTFFGLAGFLLSGSDLSDETKVTNLIIGVLVSMVTSLFGLALTTTSNHKAATAKKELDEQKNEFLDFIQLEVIPNLKTTITTLQQTMGDFVPKFDKVINNFERAFTGIIGRFKETFDECTDNFGTEFRENSSLISETVATLNESIGKITANVEKSLPDITGHLEELERNIVQRKQMEQDIHALLDSIDHLKEIVDKTSSEQITGRTAERQALASCIETTSELERELLHNWIEVFHEHASGIRNQIEVLHEDIDGNAKSA